MTFLTATCGAAELSATDAQAQWVHLFPAGEVTGRDGRTFVLGDPEAVMAASKSGAVDLPVDYEHQLDTPESGKTGPVRAAGWIRELQLRADGIWGRVEWTETAQNMIEAREYRYLSPVVHYSPQDRQVRRITGAALVHRPNLELTALSSEEPRGRQDAVALGKVATALGLPQTADLAEVMTALNAALKPDPARYVPIDAVKELLREHTTNLARMSEHDATRRVEGAMQAGFITPAMKPWAIALCKQNPDSFSDFLSSATPAYAHLFRKIDYPKTEDRPGGISADEQAICAQLGIKPEVLR